MGESNSKDGKVHFRFRVKSINNKNVKNVTLLSSANMVICTVLIYDIDTY